MEQLKAQGSKLKARCELFGWFDWLNWFWSFDWF